MPDDELPDSGRKASAEIGGRPVRFWVILALVVVGAVLVLQNSGNTEVHVLWFTVRMPLVFLLVAMVLVGVALDRAWQWRQRGK